MKIKIDYDRCMGDGHCSEVCPKVFDYDDAMTEVRVSQAEIPPELEKLVRRAAEECDTDAILIEE
ncbi:ferredoxin [Thermodesulfobacteriota bacterium]